MSYRLGGILFMLGVLILLLLNTTIGWITLLAGLVVCLVVAVRGGPPTAY